MTEPISRVFVVTCGSYSDYKILAVFSDEERLAEFVGTKEDVSVETWTLNQPHNGQSGRPGYEVFAYKGRSSTGWKWTVVDRGHEWWDVLRPSVEVCRFDTGGGDITVLGKDRDHAHKIIRDEMTRYDAMEAGIA